jgi:hypothetical protein
MNEIMFPLRLGMKGPKVGDLQDALQFILGRAVLQVPPGVSVQVPGEAGDATQRVLSEANVELQRDLNALQREHAEQTYGAATGKLVSSFQEFQKVQFRLQVNGTVDKPTADAINAMLSQSGQLEKSGARMDAKQIKQMAGQAESLARQALNIQSEPEAKSKFVGAIQSLVKCIELIVAQLEKGK